MARLPLSLALAGLVLAGCYEDDRLPGERIPIRDTSAVTVEVEGSAPVQLPGPVDNANWTHEGGSSLRSAVNPALGEVLEPVWARRVGPVGRSGLPKAPPVVADGRVFTFAGNGLLAATSLDGEVLWTDSTIPENESDRSAFGGGIAWWNGTLYVATGFGELRAVDPETGDILWLEQFNAPFRAGPAVSDNRVVVRDAADVAHGIEAETGRRVWQVQGAVGLATTGDTAPPALVDGLAIVPFTSGELLAITAQNGRQVWGLTVGAGRRELARGIISDVTGGPVVAGVNIYAANQTGTLLALDGSQAQRLWQLENGAQDLIAVGGGSIYVVTDRAILLRVLRETGDVVWARGFPQTHLDLFDDERPAVYYGPVVAGGRVWLAGSDGTVTALDPEDGDVVSSFTVEGGLAAAPAIAGGRMYLLSRTGLLSAYE
ncbi:MAG: PQQ-binding-like beta-propeller repeat protein [Pseudomonadota bacterium]